MALSPLRLAVHLLAWIPFVGLLTAYLSGNLTVNPIQAATQWSGRFALGLLITSLACTPLDIVFGWRAISRHRRALGLYAFLYASLHLLILVGLDYGFALALLWKDLAFKPYILVGAGALLILTTLAVTSFKWWQKRLGKGWKRLHRLVYLAAVLAVLHFAWARKGNLFTLSGDIGWPLAAALGVAFLLLVRLPPLRRRLVRWRQS